MQEKRIGIFLPHFQGERLCDFPQALANILDEEKIHYYDGVYHVANGINYVRPVTEDTLLKVHSGEMVNLVKRSGHFEAALYSAGGTVQAAEEIYRGNIDITIPHGIGDEGYLQKVRQELVPRLSTFGPEIIFWDFGYDATKGEYGDKGLTKNCHVEIARIINSAADTVCQGRLVTILCGGSRGDLATYIIPKIIAVMAELE